MIIQNKKFLIYGMGKTGISLVKFIIKFGGEVAVFDKKAVEIPKELSSFSIENRIGHNKKILLENIDAIILSPGISIQDDVIKLAVSKKIPVLSEMDFSLEYLNGVKIGITASGGKSTTTKMIYEMLKEEYEDVRIGGNYGIPICDICENSTPKTISVLEISSFILEQSKRHHFDIAVLSNISKNHLDRHKTMKKYISAKCKISKNMESPNIVILQSENANLKKEILQNARKNHPPHIVEFESVKAKIQPKVNIQNKDKNTKLQYPNRVDDGIYVDNKKVIRLEEFNISGAHNTENLLVSAMVANIMGVSEKSMVKVSKNYKPLPHRFEKIAEKHGVTYINDSKSTSGKSAETSLSVVDFPAVLMIGGSDKSDEFFDLFTKIKHSTFIIKTVLYGGVSQKLEAHAKSVGYYNYEKCKDFKSAFSIANSICVHGTSLVLIPACPSYDEFKNFEERGDAFSALVEGLDEK